MAYMSFRAGIGADMPTQVNTLLGAVESLGDNCELGFYLRANGIETGSVFRWAICPITNLIKFINQTTPLGGYLFDDLIPYSPGMVKDKHSGFCFHTAMRSVEVDGGFEFEAPEAVRRELYAKEKGKYDYLLKRFEEDLLGNSYKLYVIKANDGISDADIEALNHAILAKRKNTNFTLLHVSAGSVDECGDVVWKSPTLAKAWLSSFAPYAAAGDINADAWTNVFDLLGREPLVELPFLAASPKVKNNSAIDKSLSREKRELLSSYRLELSKIQKIEICYRFAKYSEESSDLDSLFKFLAQVDSEFYQLIGGEIVLAIKSDSPPDSIANFDEKYLHLFQLYSNLNLDLAMELQQKGERLYQQHGNSQIRFERLGVSINKTKQLVEKFKNQGLDIHDIAPKASGNFICREIPQNTAIQSEPSFESLDNEHYSIRLKKIVERPFVKLCCDDDIELAEKKWINEVFTYNISGVHFYKLNNARICHAPTGIAFKEADQYRYVFEMSDMYHYFRTAGKAAFKPLAKSLDHAYVLPRYGIKNYYHSLVDKLPALYGYHFLGLDCPILTTFELDPVELHFASLMGIDTNKIITGQNGSLQVGRALLPDIGNLRPLFFQFCASMAKKPKVVPHRNIYISRLNSPDRPMTNEKEIEKLVASYGYEVIRMEDYSLEEQMAMAASSQSIIAPHGAGLANMIFAQAGCKIIELIPEKYMTPLFKQLAANCGHQYGVLIGRTDKAAEAGNTHLAWQTDPDKLDAVLQTLACMPDLSEAC